MGDSIARSTVETYQPDALLLGGLIDFDNGTLENGQNLSRGRLVGRVTSTGEIKDCVKAAADGSEKPIGFLVHDTDASGGATDCQYIRGGWVNEDLISFDSGWTVAELRDAFDATPIRIVKPE